MESKSTDELAHEIEETACIQNYLNRNRRYLVQTDLKEYLNGLLMQKKLKKADVVRASLLDRTYVYKIFAGKKTPSRDKLIALAFGLGLSAEETQRLLKISGNRELYAKDARDALILFSLLHGKTILETNELLFENSFSTISHSDF